MKRIVIVGATSGIGREVARQLLRRGYRIGVAGRRETALQELKAEAPQQVACHKLDVTANDAPARLLALVEELGGMDIFLLSAGIGKQNAALQPACISPDSPRQGGRMPVSRCRGAAALSLPP